MEAVFVPVPQLEGEHLPEIRQVLGGEATLGDEQCALLAKQALCRNVAVSNPDEFYAAMESEMLERVNSLGIGPQGFGGRTTALSVAIEARPTHITGLPVAVNVGCHVTRHAELEL